MVGEGFNKLGLKDPRVQRLFKEHLQTLKKVRHYTYHFTLIEVSPNVTAIIGTAATWRRNCTTPSASSSLRLLIARHMLNVLGEASGKEEVAINMSEVPPNEAAAKQLADMSQRVAMRVAELPQ